MVLKKATEGNGQRSIPGVFLIHIFYKVCFIRRGTPDKSGNIIKYSFIVDLAMYLFKTCHSCKSRGYKFYNSGHNYFFGFRNVI